MTIIAKYASKCATCGQTVTPGTKIEWSKGSPVRHTACGASSASSARTGSYRTIGQRQQVRQASTGWTGCSCGSIEDSPRASDCRSCRFENEDM